MGLACIVAAWYYTGGKRPYGYAGFGEVAVFVFFGLVATTGTAFVQTEELTALAVAAAVPVGLMASALLVANNLRDIDQDRAAGKRTLAVRLGDRGTAWLYAVLVAAAFAVGGVLAIDRPWTPADAGRSRLRHSRRGFGSFVDAQGTPAQHDRPPALGVRSSC